MKKLLLALSIFAINETFGQSNQQSVYELRNRLTHQADSMMMEGQTSTPVYVNLLKKIAATDTDTFLVAADAYGLMKYAFSYGENEEYAKIAEETELHYVEKSLEKYPDNFDAYVYRLRLYKYAENKDGEAELIKTMQQKFGNLWKMNVVLAHHYITMDFLWPDSEGFDVCAGYLKKAVELNPEDFNSLLLLSVAYENDKTVSMMYLKKMYALAPAQFVKNTGENKSKAPYVVKSLRAYPLLGKDLTVALTVWDCKLLNLH